jgi:hypothetical protein
MGESSASLITARYWPHTDVCGTSLRRLEAASACEPKRIVGASALSGQLGGAVSGPGVMLIAPFLVGAREN